MPTAKSCRKRGSIRRRSQGVIELRKEMGVYKPPFAPPERFYDASYWTEAMGLPEK